jgi:hypothetical protein
MNRFLIMILVILFTCSSSRANNKVNKSAEEWIINSLMLGKDANLIERYPNENKRIISSKFLKDLILNPNNKSKNPYPRIRIDGAIIKGDLIIEYEDINRPIFLIDCRFNGNVSLSKSTIKRDFAFKDCCFDSSVSLNGIKTDGDLDISNSTFNKSFSCLDANINGNLFSDGIYKDIVAFSGTVVGGNWYFFKGTQFFKEVYMEGLKTNDLFMDNFKSLGDIDLESIHTQLLRISKSNIKGDLKLSGAEISRVVFLEVDTFMTVAMNHMLIGDVFQLTNTIFYNKCDLNSTQIKSDCIIENVEFRDTLFLVDIRTEKISLSKNILFNGLLSFAGTRTNSLTLGAKFKIGPNYFPASIGGFTFNNIIAGESEEKACINTLMFFSKFKESSVQPYKSLEKYFDNSGQTDLADQVYIESRIRLAEHQTNIFRKTPDFFLRYFVGYGRHPSYAIFWAIGVCIIGCFVFREKHMTQLKCNSSETLKYSSIIYSFDLLIPFVKLTYSEIWIPKCDQFINLRYKIIQIPKGYQLFTFFWFRFQKIFGWIALTVGLLAVTGLIQ